MPADPVSAINNLARTLRALKSEPESLPVLYIGERASLANTGYSWHEEIERHVVTEWGNLSIAQVDALSPLERSARFTAEWGGIDKRVRRVVMHSVMRQLRPPSSGFQALAKLLNEGYFRLVLTANPDTLIEDALAAAGVRSIDYHRAINQLDQLPRIRSLLSDFSRKFLIFKLIGDFGLVDLEATDITPRQIRTLMERTRDILAPYLALPLVIVGHGTFDDDILYYFPSDSNLGNVTFVGDVVPPAIEEQFYARRIVSITGPDMMFDSFTLGLAQALSGGSVTITPTLPPVLPEPEPRPQSEQQPHSETQSRPASPAGADSGTQPWIEFLPDDPDDDAFVSRPFAPPAPTLTRPSQRLSTRPGASARETSPSVVEDLDITVFNVDVDVQKGLSFRLSGGRVFKSDERLPWESLDIDRENLEMQRLGDMLLNSYQMRSVSQHHEWREQAKQKGGALFRSLGAAHPELGKQLAAAMQDFDGYQLTLCFNGPLPHLSIPYELLYNRDTPLAVSYPMCRHVTGVPVRSHKFDDFVGDLRAKKKELQVLLIASGGDTDLNVDQELEEVANIITQRAKVSGFKVAIKRLPSDKATVDKVKSELTHCKHHLIHFAGHGYFDPADGERSGIVLRTGSGLFSKPETTTLTAHEISMLLRQRDTQTQLVYLSSCVGAAGAPGAQLLGRDSLGTLDALVRAEIPYVFGFRWYVSDRGGRTFAQQFYSHLFDGLFIPEQSVMEARRSLYTNDPMDETWASSILVAQHVRDN